MLQKLAGDDPEAMLDKEVVLDWWSKFYTSANHDEAGPKYEGDKIQVLDHPLESVYDLADQIDTFVISKGSDEHRTKTGVFKGNFAVFILDGAGRDPTEYDADGKPIQVKAEAVKAKSVVAKSMERIGLRRRVSRRENEKRASFGQDSNKDIIHKYNQYMNNYKHKSKIIGSEGSGPACPTSRLLRFLYVSTLCVALSLRPATTMVSLIRLLLSRLARTSR